MVATLEGIIALEEALTGVSAVTLGNTLKIAQSENQNWNKISNENPGQGTGGRINVEFPTAVVGATALTLTVKDRAVAGTGSYTDVMVYNIPNYATENGTFSVDLPDVLRAEVAFDVNITGTVTAGTMSVYMGERVPVFTNF